MPRYFYKRDYFRNTITGTYAMLSEGEVLAIGYAKTNPNEQGEKAIGRDVAERRAQDIMETLDPQAEDVVASFKKFPTSSFPTLVAMASTMNYDDFCEFAEANGVSEAFLSTMESYYA